MKVRDSVIYVDEDGDENEAFVAGIVLENGTVSHDDSKGEPTPDLNLYFLSKNPGEKDKLGRQPIRKNYVFHISKSNARRKCWREKGSIIPGGM